MRDRTYVVPHFLSTAFHWQEMQNPSRGVCVGETFGAREFPSSTLFLRQGYSLPWERDHSLRHLSGRDFQGAGWTFLCLFVCRQKRGSECCWWHAGRNATTPTPPTPSPPHPPPKKELIKWLCLYGVIIVQAVSVVTNDSKYMVLQDQERAQGLLNMAVKVKQALVFKEQHGVLFIFAPN